jgi:hypothetical protein
MFNFLKRINHSRLKRRNLKKLRSRENELIKFGPNAKAIFVETKQGDFLVDPRDNFVAKKLLNDGEYSQHEIKLASRFLKKILIVFSWWAHWLFSYPPCKIM